MPLQVNYILQLLEWDEFTRCTVQTTLFFTSTCMSSFYCITPRETKKKSQYQTSLQHEFSFYWLNLSLQEDSCIAKTEPDTSSSAVVVYSLKLHQNQDAFDVTEKTLELHYSTLRYGWGEEAAATDSGVQRKKKGRGHIP